MVHPILPSKWVLITLVGHVVTVRLLILFTARNVMKMAAGFFFPLALPLVFLGIFGIHCAEHAWLLGPACHHMATKLTSMRSRACLPGLFLLWLNDPGVLKTHTTTQRLGSLSIVGWLRVADSEYATKEPYPGHKNIALSSY